MPRLKNCRRVTPYASASNGAGRSSRAGEADRAGRCSACRAPDGGPLDLPPAPGLDRGADAGELATVPVAIAAPRLPGQGADRDGLVPPARRAHEQHRERNEHHDGDDQPGHVPVTHCSNNAVVSFRAARSRCRRWRRVIRGASASRPSKSTGDGRRGPRAHEQRSCTKGPPRPPTRAVGAITSPPTCCGPWPPCWRFWTCSSTPKASPGRPRWGQRAAGAAGGDARHRRGHRLRHLTRSGRKPGEVRKPRRAVRRQAPRRGRRRSPAPPAPP